MSERRPGCRARERRFARTAWARKRHAIAATLGSLFALGCGSPVLPQVGQFRLAVQLLEPRADLAAAMLGDGRILIVGGGLENGQVLGSAEVFDPSNNALSRTRCGLRVPRRRALAVTLSDGRVMVIGGDAGNLYPILETEIFDPATSCFSDGPPLRERRQSVDRALALADGRVLVVMGLPLSETAGGAEIFDPATGEFAVLDRDLGMRTEVGAVVVLSSGHVLLAGGYEVPFPGPSLVPSRRVFLFDPVADRFTELPTRLSEARSAMAAVADRRGGAFIIGGAPYGEATNLIEYFEGGTQQVRTRGRLLVPRLNASAVLWDDWVLVVGGTSRLGVDAPLRTTEWLPTSGHRAAFGPPLEQGVEFGHRTFALPGGRIAVVRAAHYPDAPTAAILVASM